MVWPARLSGISGAALLAQFPQFFMQYLHELSGRVGELAYQNSILHESAKISQKTLPQLISKFTSNSDPDIQRQGEFMQGIVDRFEAFSTALAQLQTASVLGKPFIFLRYFDFGIAKDTFRHFHFGFTFTIESFLYAVIGLFLGYAAYRGLQAAWGTSSKEQPQ